MTKQSVTLPSWLIPPFKFFWVIIIPVWFFVSGLHYVEGEYGLSGSSLSCGSLSFFYLMKPVNKALWFAIGMRLVVAFLLFIAGMYIELGDYTFGIFGAVLGLGGYASGFKQNVSALGIASAETATDDSTDEESEKPE